MSEDKPQTREAGCKGDNHESFSDLWLEFSQSTGIHAVNKVWSLNGFGLRSMLWILAICCTTGFLIYNLVEELKDFYKYPIITTITLEEREELEFPSITICNRCTLNRSRVIEYPGLEEYFFASSIIGKTMKSSQRVTQNIFHQPLSQEWWRNISMDATKVFKLCIFAAQEIDCGIAFTPVFTGEGLCHTFNSNSSQLKKVQTGGSEFNLIVLLTVRQDDYTFRSNMASGVKIFIHNSWEHPDTSSSVVFASPGFSTYIGMEKSQYFYLPHPYTAFTTYKCVDTLHPSFINPLKYYPHYTYFHCTMECRREAALAECGCVGPDDPQDAPMCSIFKQRCYDNYMLAAERNDSDDQRCNCPVECKYTTYDTRTSYSGFPAEIWSETLLKTTDSEDINYMKNNLLELRIFYDKMFVITTKQTPQHSESSIFSSIGGQMGLCLGASLLTLVELLEFLVFAMLYVLDKIRGRKSLKRIRNLK